MAKKINSTEVDADVWELPGSTYALIPEGSYTAKILNARKGISAAGHPKLDLELLVEYEGDTRKTFKSLSLQPQAMFRIRELLEAVGLVDPRIGTVRFRPSYKMRPDGEHVTDLEGRSVGVVISEAVYEGQPRNQVDAFFKPDEDAEIPWNPAQAQEM